MPDLLRVLVGCAQHRRNDLDREGPAELVDGVEAGRVHPSEVLLDFSVTVCASAWIARGVNTLFSRLRMSRWSGGSIMMIMRNVVSTGFPLRTAARSVPRAEE